MVDFGKIAKQAQQALSDSAEKLETAVKDNAGKIEGAVDKAGQFAKDKFPDKELQFWRGQLGRFGLSGAHQTSPIRTLSDGLRNRVVFSQLAMEQPHILLLDEPTNHLDMGSIDALAQAIKEFEGGVVIVSHDFRLISQVAEDLWEVKDRKIVNLSKMDVSIQDYKKKLAKNSAEAIERAKLFAKGKA